MEVNRKFFQERLPFIVDSIKTCDFYAIDTEFTGHTTSYRDKVNDFDTLEVRYQKLKFACQNHLACQFGLSTFRYEPQSTSYYCQIYTFQVFPRMDIFLDESFLVSSNVFKFFADNNFPLGKVISEGIVNNHNV